MALPAVPPTLKPVQHYVKTAIEYDARDPAVSYYCECFLEVKHAVSVTPQGNKLNKMCVCVSWLSTSPEITVIIMIMIIHIPPG